MRNHVRQMLGIGVLVFLAVSGTYLALGPPPEPPPGWVRFDEADYRARCQADVTAELFTTGTFKSAANMPQDLKPGEFPIALPSPMVHIVITNHGGQVLELKESRLRDALFAIDRRGYIPPVYSMMPMDRDRQIFISPGESYTFTTFYPPLAVKEQVKVFWLRTEGIYSEPLKVTYR